MSVHYKLRFGMGEISFELITDWAELAEHWRHYTTYFVTDAEPMFEYVATRKDKTQLASSAGTCIDFPREIDLYFTLEWYFTRDLVTQLSKRYSIYHGAVLAHDNLATIYLGEPDSGKSALCVEEIRTGATYLSSDLAAVIGNEVISLPRPISFNNLKKPPQLIPANDPLFTPLNYSFVDKKGMMRQSWQFVPNPLSVAPAGTRFFINDVIFLEKIEDAPPRHNRLEGTEKRARMALNRFPT